MHESASPSCFFVFFSRLSIGQIEELAFASTGEFFLTRDPEVKIASLWSVKPTGRLVQVPSVSALTNH